MRRPLETCVNTELVYLLIQKVPWSVQWVSEELLTDRHQIIDEIYGYLSSLPHPSVHSVNSLKSKVAVRLKIID
jgi:hypothetical protein